MCIILTIANTVLCFANSSVNMRTGSYGNIPLFWINALSAIIIYWNISSYIDSGITSGILIKAKRSLENIGQNSIVYLCLNQLTIWFVETVLNKLQITFSMWGLKCLIILIASLFILKIVEHLTMTTKLRILFGK